MAGDATPPSAPPPPAPELPPGLLAEYLESARAQLGVLAGLAERLVVAGGDRAALDALRRETHKVHGSAGSYGFMEASRLAAGMGAARKGWAARPPSPRCPRSRRSVRRTAPRSFHLPRRRRRPSGRSPSSHRPTPSWSRR